MRTQNKFRMDYNSNISLLTIPESLAIKGFLIILIALGHNMFFTYTTVPVQFMGYIYCFHIQAFFILPFLYGRKKPGLKRFMDYFARLYWPYIIITTVLYCCYYIVYQHNQFSMVDLLSIWIFSDNLKQYCGIQILWFMPAMFSLLVLKDIFYALNKPAKAVVLLISAITLVLSLLSQDWGRFYNLFQVGIFSHIPFMLCSAMGYLVIGVATRRVIDCVLISKLSLSHLFILWIILTIFYFLDVLLWNRNIILLSLIMAVFPTLFVVVLYRLRDKLQNSSCLKKLGDASFHIYIAHPFIGYVMFFIIMDFQSYMLPYKIIIIAVSLFLMIIGGYLFHLSVKRNLFVQRFIFPRSIRQLLGIIDG